MLNIIEGVPRRKLYDYTTILESFLLELEQFILYKNQSTLEVETQNPNFREGLLDIFNKCIIVIHFFFEHNIIPSSTEFLKEVSNQQKDIINQIQRLKRYELFTSDECDTLVELYLNLNSNWTLSLDTIKDIFERLEEFHTKLIKVLEFQRK